MNKCFNESEFWNVLEKYAKIGRCNEHNESVFYSSNDIITSILEVKSLVGDYMSVSGFNKMFKYKSFDIKPFAKRSPSKIKSLKNELFKNYTFENQHLILDDFMDDLFCFNIVEEDDYKLSNAVS